MRTLSKLLVLTVTFLLAAPALADAAPASRTASAAPAASTHAGRKKRPPRPAPSKAGKGDKEVKKEPKPLIPKNML